MPSIANQFGGVIMPFDNTGAWDLTGIALTDPRLTNNVPGTTMPTGSGVPSGIFNAVAGPINTSTNPLGGDLAEDFCKYAYSEADQVLSTCGFEASTDSPVFQNRSNVDNFRLVYRKCNATDPALLDDADNVQVIKVIDVFGTNSSWSGCN